MLLVIFLAKPSIALPISVHAWSRSPLSFKKLITGFPSIGRACKSFIIGSLCQRQGRTIIGITRRPTSMRRWNNRLSSSSLINLDAIKSGLINKIAILHSLMAFLIALNQPSPASIHRSCRDLNNITTLHASKHNDQFIFKNFIFM